MLFHLIYFYISTMNKVYEAIKKLRTSKGYSQEYMANKLEITQGSYGKLERGETSLTIERLNEVANLLGSSIEQIFSSAPVNESISNLNEQISTHLEKIKALEKDLESAKHYNSLLKGINENLQESIELLLENELMSIQSDWIKEKGQLSENDREECFTKFFQLKHIKRVFELKQLEDANWVQLWKKYG